MQRKAILGVARLRDTRIEATPIPTNACGCAIESDLDEGVERIPVAQGISEPLAQQRPASHGAGEANLRQDNGQAEVIPD